HNLARLLDLGIRATVNSDDPAYFGGYIPDNFIAAQRALHLSRDQLVRLVKNSFGASFLGEERKTSLLAEVDEYVAANS
ncbi:MAG: adenosine deaminase, partial [Gemmatimonadales bacterium]